MIEGLWVFKDRKTGHEFASRHEYPDFVYGMTDKEIKGAYEIRYETDKNFIKKHTLHFSILKKEKKNETKKK